MPKSVIARRPRFYGFSVRFNGVWPVNRKSVIRFTDFQYSGNIRYTGRPLHSYRTSGLPENSDKSRRNFRNIEWTFLFKYILFLSLGISFPYFLVKKMCIMMCVCVNLCEEKVYCTANTVQLYKYLYLNTVQYCSCSIWKGNKAVSHWNVITIVNTYPLKWVLRFTWFLTAVSRNSSTLFAE